jgi:hypothetical protein
MKVLGAVTMLIYWDLELELLIGNLYFLTSKTIYRKNNIHMHILSEYLPNKTQLLHQLLKCLLEKIKFKVNMINKNLLFELNTLLNVLPKVTLFMR